MRFTRSALSFLGVISICLTAACIVDDIPACPGQCFEYTVEYPTEQYCTNGEAAQYTISFTGTAPDGYHGRYCSNAASNVLVADAIDHLQSGGTLATLSPDAAAAYNTMVATIEAQVHAGCMAAAPDQCTDEEVTCDGIVGDMHAQLITAQTCVLDNGGVENIPLRKGEVCHLNPSAFGSTGPESDSCTESTSDGSVDDTTGEMAGSPFGDIEALVSCEPQTECQIDSQLLTNISANIHVFAAEAATLTIVDGQAPCGPGAQLGGLDAGEHSTDLATAIDLRNGDVIREAESITIEDLEDAMQALSSLLESPSTTLVVHRPGSAGCEPLTYHLDVP